MSQIPGARLPLVFWGLLNDKRHLKKGPTNRERCSRSGHISRCVSSVQSSERLVFSISPSSIFRAISFMPTYAVVSGATGPQTGDCPDLRPFI